MTAPLQYESLKIVIQYLDPNLRFHLAQRLPSIRLTEKTIPLKLKTLKFSERTITVNDTSYRIGVYRDYAQLTPIFHWKDNNQGGTTYDLDQWGCVDYSSENVITPGDGVLPSKFPIPQENHHKEHLERYSRLYQKSLAQRLRDGEQPIVLAQVGPVDGGLPIVATFGYSGNQVETPEVLKDREASELVTLRRMPIRTIQYCVEKLLTDLKPHYCKRDNIQPEFTPKLQLTMKAADGEVKHIYRFEYNIKLHEAMKNLSLRLLGGRRHPIKVKTLNTNGMHGRIIRLPVDLKLATQNLYIYEGLLDNYRVLDPYLDRSSFPLSTLSVESGMVGLMNCDHDDLRHAKHLILSGTASHQIEDYSQLFMQLRNPRVEILSPWMDFPVAHQINLIRNWKETERPVGAYFSYKVREEAKIKALLVQIRRQLGGKITRNRLATIPVSIDHCVTVECCEGEVHPLDSPHDFVKWTIKLRVLIREDN